MVNNTNRVITERGKNYGPFKTHAELTQRLKNAVKVMNWDSLSFSQKEALEMIMHKIGRIVNGRADYKDSWVDIAGYATLVADELSDD